jgi:tetratricopeptide (TPR) repeat protein
MRTTAVATAQVPRTFINLYEQGRALLLKKQYPEAASLLAQALILAPRTEQPLVLTDLGYCHLQMLQFTQALDDCEKALALDPQYHYGYYLRSSVYAQMNAFDKSIADLEHCLVLKPDDVMTLKLLGYVYYMKNDFATALSVFDGLAQPGEDWVYVQNFRAKIFRKLGRDEDASAALEKVLDADPTYADAYCMMGLICEDHKAYQDAIDAYTLYLKYANPRDPDNAEWIHNAKQRMRKLRFKMIFGLN